MRRQNDACAIRACGAPAAARAMVAGSSRMRMRAATYFRYSDSMSFVVAPCVHQGSACCLSVITGNGEQGDVRELMGDLGDGARHVVVRGDDDQRAEAAALRPVPGLDRVAERVQRTIEIDAAADHRAEFGVEARYLARGGGRVDAADQQALAAAGGEQLDRVGDARGAAGEHDDAVGIAMRARPRRPAGSRGTRRIRPPAPAPRPRTSAIAERPRCAAAADAPARRSAPPAPGRCAAPPPSVFDSTIGIDLSTRDNHSRNSARVVAMGPSSSLIEPFRACG